MNKKRTSEKKGISLIVLVITIIVIIILAVAVILSIANNNPIENSKEARFKNDVKTMQEELELLKASNYAKNNGTGYNDPTTGNQIELSDLKSSTNYTDDFEVKDGELYIKSKNNLTDKEKELAKKLGVAEEKASITFDRVDKTKALAIGSEVTASNGEAFYVIGGDTVGTEISNSTQDILLLAKYNLTSDGSSQDQNGNSNCCAFSNTEYWGSVEGIAYPDTNGKYPDLNNEAKYGTGSSVIAKAKAYGASLGVTGRLMTYEEAKALQTDYSEILYGKNIEKGYLNYWLGSAYSESNVWVVNGGFSTLSSNTIYFIGANGFNGGVRPVIKVSKSLVQ